MKNAKLKFWRVNPGDIMICETGSRLSRFIKRVFKRKLEYTVGFAVCPEARVFDSKIKWYTPRRQYSKEERLAFILAMVQLPSSLNMDEIVVILINTIRPNTIISSEFNSMLDISKNPYYRELQYDTVQRNR